MFADFQLARRIERVEASLSREVAEATVRGRAGSHDVSALVRPLAGGVAVFTGADSPITKVIGVGFEGVPSAEELDDLERAFFERQSGVRFEVAALADPAIFPCLTRRGYLLEGFENVLGRALGAGSSPEHVPGVEVTQARDDRAWTNVLIEGFRNPDTGVPSAPGEVFPRDVLERIFTDIATANGFLRYMAYVDGQAAGSAGMRLSGGVAQLTGAATLPSCRRRGVQTALLNVRLREATAAGCDISVVTTQPGSKSQQNAQHQGFVPLYTRAVLVKGQS